MNVILATVSLDVGSVGVVLSLGKAGDGVVLNVERHCEEEEERVQPEAMKLRLRERVKENEEPREADAEDRGGDQGRMGREEG